MHRFVRSHGLLALPFVLAGCVPAIGGVILYGAGSSSSSSPSGPTIEFETEWTLPPSTAVTAGDIDGDDDVDLISAPDEHTGPLRVYANTGTRRAPVFTEAGTFGASNRNILALYLADLDGDLDLDLVIVEPIPVQGKVWFNDGTGAFTDSGQALDALGGGPPQVVVVVDVDGDDALDLVTGDGFGLHVWRNDGAGSFVLTASIEVPFGRLEQLVAGDLDGDDDVDLLGPFGTAEALYWVNDGSGAFSANGSIFAPVGNDIPRLAIADVDRDGDSDVIGSVPDSDWFALNDGHGVFGPAWTFDRQFSNAAAIEVADFDRDGYVDVVNWQSSADRVYLNVGHPSFVHAATLSTASETNGGGPGQLVVIDVNADGKPDIVQAIEGVGLRIFRNKHGE
jgi:hypothetical protein